MNIKLFLKGMAMGAADIVPGVSGGTIAFISGIYEKLIHSLSQFDPKLISVWRKEGFAEVWRTVNGTFLLTLFGGILTSILLFASLIKSGLENYPIFVWSFFFGLILASAKYIGSQITGWNGQKYAALLGGVLVAYLISTSPAFAWPSGHLGYFTAGAIAICAMVLPGVSGSFLLVLMGMYEPVLQSVRDFNLMNLAGFAVGCLLGLLIFVRAVNYMLKHFHGLTLAVLLGFMLGALPKVWPWKHAMDDSNLMPTTYSQLTGEPSYWWVAILLMVAAGALVLFLERLGDRK